MTGAQWGSEAVPQYPTSTPHPVGPRSDRLLRPLTDASNWLPCHKPQTWLMHWTGTNRATYRGPSWRPQSFHCSPSPSVHCSLQAFWLVCSPVSGLLWGSFITLGETSFNSPALYILCACVCVFVRVLLCVCGPKDRVHLIIFLGRRERNRGRERDLLCVCVHCMRVHLHVCVCVCVHELVHSKSFSFFSGWGKGCLKANTLLRVTLDLS